MSDSFVLISVSVSILTVSAVMIQTNYITQLYFFLYKLT